MAAAAPQRHRCSIAPRLVVLPLLVAIAAGCASAGQNPMNGAMAPSGTADYTVEVVNRNWQDVTVYAVRGTATHRLGFVAGNQSRVLKMPAAFVGHTGAVQLAARPRGESDLHYVELLDLAPNQTVGLSLEPNLKLSFAWTR